MLDGSGCHALVQGGRYFCEETEARIEGATCLGSSLRVGWICLGLRLELLVNGKRIVTSRVRAITSNLSAPRARGKTMQGLIGYASRFGSTWDIAIRIADAIRTDGNDVDLRSVNDISDFDRYDAVVFGSGVYDGSWTAEATELMRRHAAVLARKPVWLFSVGSFGDRHPIVGGLIKKEPKEIGESEEALHPCDYRVFAGVIDLDYWPAWGRLLFKALGGHAGDNRQWPDIDAWAQKIAQELRARA